MTRLKAQNKELGLRPPIEEFAASWFGYSARQSGEASTHQPIEIPDSELPEFEP